MLFQNKPKNRRGERDNVLDVKMHSRHVRAVRLKRLGKSLAWLISAVLLVSLGWFGSEVLVRKYVLENPTFAIRAIDARSDGLIPAESLVRWSGVSLGDNLFRVDLGRVERDLRLNTFIRDVAVEREVPGTLWIRVSERKPRVQFTVWKEAASGEGWRPVRFYLDDEAICIVPEDLPLPETDVRHRFDALPVIKGLDIKQTSIGKPVASAPVRAALELVRMINESALAGVDEPEEIDVSNPRALTVKTRRNSQVTLGFEDLFGQLQRWRLIHDYAANAGVAIATLDLSVTNNVPARWQDAGAVPPAPVKSSPSSTRKKKNV